MAGVPQLSRPSILRRSGTPLFSPRVRGELMAPTQGTVRPQAFRAVLSSASPAGVGLTPGAPARRPARDATERVRPQLPAELEGPGSRFAQRKLPPT